MKRFFFLQLILALGVLGALAYAAFLPGAFEANAAAHSLSPQMLKSRGPQPQLTVLGPALAAILVSLMGSCIILGLSKRGRLGGVGKGFIFGLLAYISVFAGLFAAYEIYAAGDCEVMILGFPASTAFMVYGVWLSPLILVGLYIYSFDRWYLTDEDMERFQAILAMRNAALSGPEAGAGDAT